MPPHNDQTNSTYNEQEQSNYQNNSNNTTYFIERGDFGSPSFIDKYEIHDIDSAMESVFDELQKETNKLQNMKHKTGKIDGIIHFYFCGLAVCFLCLILAVATQNPTIVKLIIVAISVLFIVGITFQVQPMRNAKQAEKMQEMKMDIIYKILGHLQEKQIWELIKEKK